MNGSRHGERHGRGRSVATAQLRACAAGRGRDAMPMAATRGRAWGDRSRVAGPDDRTPDPQRPRAAAGRRAISKIWLCYVIYTYRKLFKIGWLCASVRVRVGSRSEFGSSISSFRAGRPSGALARPRFRSAFALRTAKRGCDRSVCPCGMYTAGYQVYKCHEQQTHACSVSGGSADAPPLELLDGPGLTKQNLHVRRREPLAVVGKRPPLHDRLADERRIGRRPDVVLDELMLSMRWSKCPLSAVQPPATGVASVRWRAVVMLLAVLGPHPTVLLIDKQAMHATRCALTTVILQCVLTLLLCLGHGRIRVAIPNRA